MARYDATNAEVLVFTFKEGLLSAMAHDLKLRVTRFVIEEEGGAVRGDFDADSIRVVAPMKDGQESGTLVPAITFGEIERNIEKDVLQPRKHPRITFTSASISDTEVTGQLSLHGSTRTVRGTRKDEGGRRIVEVRLDQRDYGIKPYSALLGTLKIKPEVVVRVSLPGGATSS